MTTTQTQIRRDTATNIAAATPAAGEPFYDTTNKRLGVGDGLTPGGLPHASAADVQGQKFTYPAVGGTGNAITLTNTPPKAALVAGQKGTFKAGASNTTAVQINEDGRGLKNAKKMQGGTLVALVANDVIAGGMYDYVYDGTQYQITGLAGGGGGSLKFLGSATASTSATIDLTSLLSATYDDYLVVLDNVTPGTSGVQLLMQFSPDNSTFDSGANYEWMVGRLNGLNTATNTASSGSTGVAVADSVDIGYGVSGSIFLHGVNNASVNRHCHGELVWNDPGSGHLNRGNFGGQWLNTANAIEAVRFLFSSGNITSGTFKVYGLSKS